MPLPPNVPGTLGLALIVIQQSQRETLGPRVPGWPKLGAQAGPVYCATGVPSRAARSLDSTRARPPAGPGPCGGVAPGRMGRQACGAGPWRQLSRAPVWDPGPKRNPGTAALPPSLCTVAAPGLTPRPKLGGEPPARGVPGILQVGNAPRPVRGVNGAMNEHYAPATGKYAPSTGDTPPRSPPPLQNIGFLAAVQRQLKCAVLVAFPVRAKYLSTKNEFPPAVKRKVSTQSVAAETMRATKCARKVPRHVANIVRIFCVLATFLREIERKCAKSVHVFEFYIYLSLSCDK